MRNFFRPLSAVLVDEEKQAADAVDDQIQSSDNEQNKEHAKERIRDFSARLRGIGSGDGSASAVSLSEERVVVEVGDLHAVDVHLLGGLEVVVIEELSGATGNEAFGAGLLLSHRRSLVSSAGLNEYNS